MLPALLAMAPQWLLAGDYPPATPAHADTPTTLYLELDVNGQASGGLIEVTQRGLHFEIEAATLRSMHIRTAAPDGTPVVVDALVGVTVTYNSLAQHLRIDVPPEWLPQQMLRGAPREGSEISRSDGLLMNYDLYATKTRGPTNISLWSEQRIFGAQGVFSHTGVMRYMQGGTSNGYLRYDTSWTDVDPGTASSVRAGDLISGALGWTTPVRMAGVQWARNFASRPDLVTYPMPEFAGQAAVPSAVDVFVNGFRASRHNVQPGPFTLGDLPAVSGAGMASVVTTDALGRQVVASIPFYVNNQLLRPGWTDYSLSIGALRRDYGLRNFSYGPTLAAGVYRRGITDTFTLETQAQAGQGLTVLGAGGLARWGTLGVFNASITHGRASPGNQSDARGSGGWQWSAGYQYHSPKGGFSIQHIQRDVNFGDAGDHGFDKLISYRSTRQINANLPAGTGSIAAGWIDQRSRDSQRSRIAYASYSTPIGRGAYLSLTGGRTVETGHTQIRAQLTYLLDPMMTAQAGLSHSAGTLHAETALQRSLPSDGGLGWHLGHTLSNSTDGNTARSQYLANLQYQGPNAMVQGGVFGSSNVSTHWAGASGSLGYMDGHVFAANRVTDGFALVSTGGEPNVPISFNHQPVGLTNAQGYLLVPNVPAYYPSHYAINPISLPADVHTPALEYSVAVARGTGTLVQLPVQRLRSATITLVGEDRVALPAGSAVLHEPGRHATVVGWDGIVYLTTLQPQNTLTVRLPDGTTCHAAFEESDYVAMQSLHVICHAQTTVPTPGDKTP